MTVTATHDLAPASAADGLDDHGPNQWRAIKAEWIKLRTLRSTAFTLIAAIVGMAGIGLLISAVTNANWNHLQRDELVNFDAVGRSLAGVNIAQLAVGVLGVLLVTGEYGTGMIRSTFAAIPARLPVIWAKSAVYAAITLVIMVPSAFIAFLGGQALLGTHGVSLSAPGAVRAVFGVALYLTVVGVLAGALGFIVRSTAGGIASLFGLLLVLPGLGNLLPTSWQTNVLPYLPSRAGSAVYDLRPDPGTLAPWTGFGVLCLWTALALVIAALLVRSRDV